MRRYRIGSHWGTTIIREGTQPADEHGRRLDDELALQVIDADRPVSERVALARLTARLLTVASPRMAELCDCGHQTLDARFHADGCLVAEVWRTGPRRPLGYRDLDAGSL